jgi:hypothetical protein
MALEVAEFDGNLHPVRLEVEPFAHPASEGVG